MKIIELNDKQMDQIHKLGNGAVDLSYRDVMGLRRGGYDRANAYEQWRGRIDEVLHSDSPADKAAVIRERTELSKIRGKDIAPGTVSQTPVLTNLSVQYANEEYIGEQLMPVVTVPTLTGTYYTYGQRDRMGYPDDQLGPRGQANEIHETRTPATYTCAGFGYENYVDGDTISDQDAPLDEMLDLTESCAEGLAFRRELRIAGIVGVSGSYGANTAAIAAGNRWNTVAGGDPIADIQTGLAALWTGRGASVIMGATSLDVYNVLSRHPQILDLFKYNGSSPGLATPGMIATFLGLTGGLLVGKARQDTANEAATAVYSRVWPDVFAIVRVARRPTRRNAFFGVTFRHNSVNAIQWFDQTKGVHGGYYARVALSEAHPIVAAPTGYLITTPI